VDRKEDTLPGLDKVAPTGSGGLVVKDVSGLRLQLKRRLEERDGYDVVKVGPHRIVPGATVTITDPTVLLALRMSDGATRLDLEFSLESSAGGDASKSNFSAVVSPASFGPPATALFGPHARDALLIVKPDSNVYGCEPYSVDLDSVRGGGGGNSGRRRRRLEEDGFVLLVRRGMCTFQVKSHWAAMAGAKALLVSFNDEELFTPGADDAEADIGLVATMLLTKSTGDELERYLDLAAERDKEEGEGGEAEVLVRWAEKEQREARTLVVNGHRILNAIVEP
jgi:mannosidase alpha-like ER degradation enhancer 1